MILLEVVLILYIGYKYDHYSKKKTVSIIEFVCNLFFADTINPFPGFTDFFWIPIYSAYFGVTSFLQITVYQLIFYEVTTALIGVVGFLITYIFFNRIIGSK